MQRLGLGETAPATDDLSVSRNEELLKVPLDGLVAHKARLLFLQPAEDGGGLAAIHIELAEYGECHAIVELAEGLDVIVGAGVLAAELVAGKSEDGELFGVALLQGLVELFEAFKLRGEATLGRGVHDENDLALEGGERESLALL